MPPNLILKHGDVVLLAIARIIGSISMQEADAALRHTFAL
jgi:hypothetical protein